MSAKVVLIVDDDVALRDSLEDILRDEGYTTVSAGSCAEALEVARENEFQAALLDIKLPDGSGTTLLADLKKLNPECVCVVVTAYADLDSAVSALEEGAFQYLQKPVRLMELLNILAKVFDTIHLKYQKRKAEERLIESEGRLRAIFETAEDAIFLKDLELKYVLINPKAESIFGVSAEGMMGRSDEELLRKEIAAQMRDMDHCALAGEVIEKEVVRSVCGTPKTYHEIRVPIRDDSGKIVGICVIARNITEKINLEKRLQQAQKMEAIGTLAGGIAHDFNNILSAIIGFTELAQMENAVSNKTEAYLDATLKAAKRARNLVKRILAFTRQEENEEKPVLIKTIIKECLALLRASMPATINIHEYFCDDTIAVNADPTQIHQVLMNLATNAAQAMSAEGGNLSVHLEVIDPEDEKMAYLIPSSPGRYVLLTVQDDGCGISEATQNRIFEPYYTTKEKHVGTGLGLAVVHGIVTKVGGAITVESETGKGTTFRVVLPVLDTEVPADRKASVRSLPAGSESILFVDDEEDLVNIGRDILEHLGYHVISTTNSLEALEIFRGQPTQIDLVISDQTMPKMTGDVLAQALLELKPELPIILCSGFSEGLDRDKARRMGIKEFISKPLVITKLAETVRRVLDEN